MILRIGLVVALLCWATTAFAACSRADNSTVDIYPTADVIPANTLRFYVYYPRPMATSEVRLVDDDGTHVDGAFLPTRDALWSPDHRRLTLVFDPGRVKTGLNSRDALGQILEVGRAYSFVVSGSSEDRFGCLLGQDTAYNFTVGPADLSPPDPGGWRLVEPKVATRAPLNVEIGSPHDHLSLAYRLRVLDVSGNVLPGQISLGAEEASWEFTPREPWTDQSYSLVVADMLEDLAGNRPGVPFDWPEGQEPRPWQNSLVFIPVP
ncbi:MAG: hypothetical protein AAF590_08135 [Pseudomonadota bacterium]